MHGERATTRGHIPQFRCIAEYLGQRNESLRHGGASLGVDALPESSVLTKNAFMNTLISHHMEEVLT